jgi:hypothetical protein
MLPPRPTIEIISEKIIEEEQMKKKTKMLRF